MKKNKKKCYFPPQNTFRTPSAYNNFSDLLLNNIGQQVSHALTRLPVGVSHRELIEVRQQRLNSRHAAEVLHPDVQM